MYFFTKIKQTTLIAAAVILSGCVATTPQPKREKSMFIVMKTPKLRYADQGFVSRGDTGVDVEIYASGTAVMKLTITDTKICNGSGLFGCLSREAFNSRFLSAAYPADTLERIFRAEPIFGGAGMQKQPGGFRQTIAKSGLYAIEYTVLNGSIVFRDTISHILIKVKENR